MIYPLTPHRVNEVLSHFLSLFAYLFLSQALGVFCYRCIYLVSWSVGPHPVCLMTTISLSLSLSLYICFTLSLSLSLIFNLTRGRFLSWFNQPTNREIQLQTYCIFIIYNTWPSFQLRTGSSPALPLSILPMRLSLNHGVHLLWTPLNVHSHTQCGLGCGFAVNYSQHHDTIVRFA